MHCSAGECGCLALYNSMSWGGNQFHVRRYAKRRELHESPFSALCTVSIFDICDDERENIRTIVVAFENRTALAVPVDFVWMWYGTVPSSRYGPQPVLVGQRRQRF